MRNTFPNKDCIQLGTDLPQPMLYSVLCNSTKKYASSEAVGKDKTVKTCKHSSIPGKNYFVSRSVCKLRNSCPNRAGSRQKIYHVMQRITNAPQRHIFVYFLISRTMTSQGRSENSNQSGPLHPMLPYADQTSAL